MKSIGVDPLFSSPEDTQCIVSPGQGRFNEPDMWWSLKQEIMDKPWAISHAGFFACEQAALAKDGPRWAFSHNGFIAGFWERIPDCLQKKYHDDPILDSLIIDMAKEDLKRLALENSSPDLHSEIEDLKLLSADVFGNLFNLGLIPYFEQDFMLEQIAYVKYNIYSYFNPEAYSERGFEFAAFYGPNDEVGFVGAENINPITFLHEATHAGLEFQGHSGKGGEGLGEACNSLREAVVQHIANRGYQFARSEYFINPEGPKLRSSINMRGKIYGFNYAGFTLEDEEGVYEEDRKIMYELCSLDDINMADFLNALMDPSGKSLKELSSKLNRAIGHLLGINGYPSDVLKFIDDRIDGENAELITGGLSERHQRAEHVLELIREARLLHDFLGKRSNAGQRISRLRKIGMAAFCKLPPVVL